MSKFAKRLASIELNSKSCFRVDKVDQGTGRLERAE